MKVRDTVDGLQRTYPNISVAYGRFMYVGLEDFKRRGKTTVLWVLFWSDDGRVSFRKTTFSRERAMSVPEWGGWLQVNAPGILVGNAIPYMNRNFGSTWNIDKVFGWHFSRRKARK
jgi:hypothetical protein